MRLDHNRITERCAEALELLHRFDMLTGDQINMLAEYRNRKIEVKSTMRWNHIKRQIMANREVAK